MLKIQLLGDFTLTYNGAPVVGANTVRLQSLLACLALHQHAPQPRRQLAFLLWPDSTEAQALTNLRKAVHHLRRALPQAGDFLAADAKTVQWKPDAPFTLDVSEFLAAVDSGALQQAVALYHGDLLPGCYDDWIIPERERLQQMLASALEKLTLQFEAACDYASAIGYAQRLLRRDPLREESYRHLMRLHAANDDRAAALHVYHSCVTTLGRELNVEPSPLTRDMYERLINVPVRFPSSVQAMQASTVPLVGRESEWSLLQMAWREASARPRLVLIKGEAGIGKTRLAEELIEWARRQGLDVLTAHCYAEGQPAYAPVAEWLRAHPLHGLEDVWLIELARLLPEIRAERPDLPSPEPLLQDWQRLRLFKALAHALVRGSRSVALLLFMDDLHWCDRDTLDWLHYLLKTPLEPPMLLIVVGTAQQERNPSLDSLRARLTRTDQLTEIELGPLAQTATLALANHVAGHELDSDLGALLYHGTEGNPLFVVEMVRAGLSPAHSLPAKVRQVIEARLAQLSPPALELVELAAVIGRAFTFDVLARASGANEETLVRGLDELWQRRIVRDAEPGETAYDFTHGKLREVAYTALSSARRRLLHRQVAEALEAIHASRREAVSDQIARHYEMSGQLGKAVLFYEQAIQAAFVVYANEDTVELVERALALIGQLPQSNEWRARWASLCEVRGDVLERIGQHDEARGAYGCAVEQTPEGSTACALRARLFRKLGKMAEMRNQYDEALTLYDRAEAALGRSDFEADRAGWQAWIEIQVERLWAYYYQNAQEPARTLLERLEPMAKAHGTLAQQADVLRCSGALACRRERFVISAEMLARAREVLTLYLQTGETAKIANGHFSLGFMLLWHGDLDEAEVQFNRLSELAAQMGNAHRRLLSLTYGAVLARKRGRIKDTRQLSQEALELATSAQIPTYVAAAQANLAWADWRDGHLDAAERQSRAALQSWEQENEIFPFLWLARFPLMRVALTCGQIETAIAQARRLLATDQERLPTALEDTLEQALAAWAQGQPQSATLHLEQALAHAQQAQYL